MKGSADSKPETGPQIDPAINDKKKDENARIAALSAYISKGPEFPPFCGEINNHIHTIYSFSPYTPAMAALMARQAGLEAAGSVDHDSYEAASEMRRACDLLGMGCVTGFEIRASLRHTEFSKLKINSPDSAGLVYMTVQGVPAAAAPKVREFLEPISRARQKRNRRMVENLNTILERSGISSISYVDEIVPLSMAASGGSVTERHILYALSMRLIREAGWGENLLYFLDGKFGIKAEGKIRNFLTDRMNPHYIWDLLGLLKSSFNDRIFVQPDEKECPPVEKVTAFGQSINAVPCYAYLGDIGNSPTGDKKAEKFEDAFLDSLCRRLRDMGFLGVTYMPPRNTAAQLERLHSLCVKNSFLEVCGVDINSPRQVFNCPEIRRPEFAMLVDTTWALAAHEMLAGQDPGRGIFNPADPLAAKPLEDRIAAFADIGRKMLSREQP